eukprot:NODE_43_length_1692_cov_347.814532_g40_i0.p1 GENE.NODE_43_length_1692_cov_347.814532_g40_i0~~NODE_43_length_1692_cov_347.814532_g40_i0.p1  ORF type:complete len:478 (+),score=94.63 NODE_43_length_1692_cov_347.814532_g40_i0:42-1475(+)
MYSVSTQSTWGNATCNKVTMDQVFVDTKAVKSCPWEEAEEQVGHHRYVIAAHMFAAIEQQRHTEMKDQGEHDNVPPSEAAVSHPPRTRGKPSPAQLQRLITGKSWVRFYVIHQGIPTEEFEREYLRQEDDEFGQLPIMDEQPEDLCRREWFVSTAPSDAHAGGLRGTKGSPFGSLDEALRVAEEADIITLMEGIYPPLTVTEPPKDLLIQGARAEYVVVDGREDTAVQVSCAEQIMIRGIHFTNCEVGVRTICCTACDINTNLFEAIATPLQFDHPSTFATCAPDGKMDTVRGDMFDLRSGNMVVPPSFLRKLFGRQLPMRAAYAGWVVNIVWQLAASVLICLQRDGSQQADDWWLTVSLGACVIDIVLLQLVGFLVFKMIRRGASLDGDWFKQQLVDDKRALPYGKTIDDLAVEPHQEDEFGFNRGQYSLPNSPRSEAGVLEGDELAATPRSAKGFGKHRIAVDSASPAVEMSPQG